ncbi:hypothetical protein QJQ45_007441 [Haematococcus lacustris]|nr:hypothetical protein QJQ45_007441 [Haematococcus lacustris]
MSSAPINWKRGVNLVLLKPRSGVWFFDCYPLDRGAKKDARFYADMHNEMANKGHTYHNALRNNFSVEAAKREVYLKANVPTTDSDDDTPAVQDTLIDIMN